MTDWQLTDLVDYLRGASHAETTEAIKQDLAAGNREARADLDLFGEVAAVVSTDFSDTPPESALRAARAAFTLTSPFSTSAPPFLETQKIGNSDAASQTVGLRGPARDHQDLHFRGAGFDLELSVDMPTESSDVVIVGRLSKAASQPWSIDEVPALLISRDEPLASTVTNRFGEFHVQCHSEDSVELRILVPDLGQIRIPLELPESGDAPS